MYVCKTLSEGAPFLFLLSIISVIKKVIVMEMISKKLCYSECICVEDLFCLAM